LRDQHLREVHSKLSRLIARIYHTDMIRFTFLTLSVLLAGCSALTPYAQVREAVPGNELLVINGQSVHVQRAGSGEPVLLLHGFGGSTYCWREVMPRLAERFEVIAIDLNGFGFTERPRDSAAYTHVGQSNLILGVMDALNVSAAHVVGHSYGGGVALTLTVNHPQRVRSLALLAAAPPGGSNPGQALTKLFSPIILWYVETFVLKPGPIRDALRSAVVDDALITAEVATEYLKRLRVEGFGDAFAGLTAASNRALTDAQLSLSQRRVLLIWGDSDTFVPLSVGQRLGGRIPQARLVVLPNVGHLSMVENPNAVVDELAAFFSESAAP